MTGAFMRSTISGWGITHCWHEWSCDCYSEGSLSTPTEKRRSKHSSEKSRYFYPQCVILRPVCKCAKPLKWLRQQNGKVIEVRVSVMVISTLLTLGKQLLGRFTSELGNLILLGVRLGDFLLMGVAWQSWRNFRWVEKYFLPFSASSLPDCP